MGKVQVDTRGCPWYRILHDSDIVKPRVTNEMSDAFPGLPKNPGSLLLGTVLFRA